MAVDLTDLEPRVRAHEGEWTALRVEVTFKPSTSGLSKNSTAAEFESAEWLASVAVWESGELDLDAGRKADGWLVAKHYDLDAMTELDAVLAEVVALFRDGSVPV